MQKYVRQKAYVYALGLGKVQINAQKELKKFNPQCKITKEVQRQIQENIVVIVSKHHDFIVGAATLAGFENKSNMGSIVKVENSLILSHKSINTTIIKYIK